MKLGDQACGYKILSTALARDLGLTLFQGNLLERAAIVDRSVARPVHG